MRDVLDLHSGRGWVVTGSSRVIMTSSASNTKDALEQSKIRGLRSPSCTTTNHNVG